MRNQLKRLHVSTNSYIKSQCFTYPFPSLTVQRVRSRHCLGPALLTELLVSLIPCQIFIEAQFLCLWDLLQILFSPYIFSSVFCFPECCLYMKFESYVEHTYILCLGLFPCIINIFFFSFSFAALVKNVKFITT